MDFALKHVLMTVEQEEKRRAKCLLRKSAPNEAVRSMKLESSMSKIASLTTL